MEYIDCPRLGDVIDNKELFENAVKSTTFFFLLQLKNGV
jgi:hypothetical protein